MMNSLDYAPIVIFAYKRPELFRRTLQALALNIGIKESEVFIFCDGPKRNASAADLIAIQQVRETASAFDSAMKLHVITQDLNKGLANSVMDGVDKVIAEFGRVIVIEDDVDLSPHFISYMNVALQRFFNNQEVGAIGSWTYFLGGSVMSKPFFLRYPDSIAWATWSDRWSLLERDGIKLYESLKYQNRDSVLNADDRVSWLTSMLMDQVMGKVDSWAIRWTASLVLNNRLTLYPSHSLSKHIGFGTDATHETHGDDYNANLKLASREQSFDSMDAIIESKVAFEKWVAFALANFHRKNSVKSKIRNIIPKSLLARYYRFRNRGELKPSMLKAPAVSRLFGLDRGTPVDRFFIEEFLRHHSISFQGDGLEIGEIRYLNQFNKNLKSAKSIVLDSPKTPNEIYGDLTLHHSLPSEVADIFVCTQTLNFIYNIDDAILGIHKVLKQNGVALITVASICQISRYDAIRWGDFWRFMPQSIFRLFTDKFGQDYVEMSVYGNLYAAHVLLHGFALEECDKNKLLDLDDDYPVIIGLKVTKR